MEGWSGTRGAIIGYGASTSGNVHVSNAGQWHSSDDIVLGRMGHGTLQITDGGQVSSAGNLITGQYWTDPGSRGDILVSGAGSTLQTGGRITLGDVGNGQMTITDGGSVTAGGPVHVGSWGIGYADVSHGGSLATHGTLHVGDGNWATLNIGPGGSVSSVTGELARFYEGVATVTVAGAGAQWNNSGDLNIGAAGVAALIIGAAGTVNSRNATLGGTAVGAGRVTIKGTDALWNNTGILDVGYMGVGTLNIADGGRLATGRTRIGHVAGSYADVNISGQESTWTNTGILTVGDNGTGSLGIRDGASVSTGGLILGNYNSGIGTLLVTGPGSRLETEFVGIGSGDNTAARNGTGRMVLSDGAEVHTNDIVLIAQTRNSRGDITVTQDSQWTIDGKLQLGFNGDASLLVATGSRLQTGLGTCIGCSGNGTATATVSGAGSSWIEADHIMIGRAGKGTLTIDDGARVVVGKDNGYLQLADFKNSTGLLNIGTGGLAGTLDTAVVQGGDGTAMVNFNHTDVSEFAAKLTGSLSVNLLGEGTTTLMARNDYSGETSLLAGTLRAGTAGAFSAASHHVLNPSAALHLGGFNQSVGSLENAGAVVFADNNAVPGTVLTVQGDYIGNGGVLHMNTALAGDDAATDRLVINGDSHGHSWLQVNNAGGAGAATSNGIQLVAVQGNSAGVFELQGRAVAGLYEYWLHQGGHDTPNDGGWYLRSEAQVVPPVVPAVAPPIDPPTPPVEPEVVEPEITEPEVIDPEIKEPETTAPEVVNPGVVTPEVVAPPLPIRPTAPVLRPEPAAYLGNQIAALRMFRSTLHDRVGDQNVSGSNADENGNSAWVRTQTSTLDAGTLNGQIEMNTRAAIAQFGLEKQFAVGAGRMHLGAVGGLGRATSEDRSIISNHHATGTVKGTNAGIYATWYPQADAQPGAYLDALVQYARFDNTVKGGYLGREQYNSQAWSLSLEAGRAFQVHAGETYGIHVEPQAQVVYTDFSSDNVREANGTLVRSQTAGSADMRLGVRVFARELSDAHNRVQPFAAFNWWSGGAAATLSMDGEQLRHDATRNLLEAKVGAQLQLGHGWSGWGQVGYQRGGDAYRDVNGQLGLKLSW